MTECSFPPDSLEQQTCLAAEAMRAAAAAMDQKAPASAQDIAVLIEALGAVLLPMAAVVLVWRLWPYLAGLLKSRDFTVKMGGAELSVQNATSQFEAQLKDSAEKIVRLERQVAQLLGPEAQMRAAAGPERPAAGKGARAPSVLWVDDHPENNAFLIATLRDRGIRVETARSTDEAMARLGQAPTGFDVVISDLGRKEDGAHRPMAGRDLAQRLREAAVDLPMLVFASARAMGRRDELLAAGVSEVTTSGTDLLRFVEENTSEGA